jgi:PPOX class probable F420-dependent enzyme
MADREPVSAHPMLADPSTPAADWLEDASKPADWVAARSIVEKTRATYWLATVRRDGSPHVMPILAVWVDGNLFFCTGGGTVKAKNLAREPRCVLTVEQEPLDLVVEGVAEITRDAATLQRVAETYASAYDWHVTVRDGAFHDTYGAPTAGPPPYEVYELTPRTVFGLPLDGTITPTRWAFHRP